MTLLDERVARGERSSNMKQTQLQGHIQNPVEHL